MKRVFEFLRYDFWVYLANVLFAFWPNLYITTRLRGAIARIGIKHCGKKFRMASGIILNKPSKLEVGSNVYIAHNAWINAVGGLSIGDDTVIGPMCVIATSKHQFVKGRATNSGVFAPIEIGAGVWIASHAVLTDGVRIGDGVLVASGAVVTKDIPDHVMVGGVPARVIRSMDGEDADN